MHRFIAPKSKLSISVTAFDRDIFYQACGSIKSEMLPSVVIRCTVRWDTPVVHLLHLHLFLFFIYCVKP